MSMDRDYPAHAIAIVGLAGRFPGALDLEAFWQNIRNGVENLVSFSDAELEAAGVAGAVRDDPRFVRQGTVLEDAEMFDAAFFGIAPREAQVIDPQQRIFLECAWEALEHAGYAPGRIDATVGVYAGAGMNTYLLSQLARAPGLMTAVGGYQLMLGNDKDFLCTRVSYKLDLRGPSVTIQTACSTSLVAVHAACRALERGECDMALAGGVSVTFPLRSGYMFQEGMILSPDGRCRPFDIHARGTRPGSGCGIVVLKRVVDAIADRDTIHAVIRGVAVNNDGAGKAGYTAPGVDGQIEAIATAQMLAGVDPRSIAFVEAHGTGTPLGDPIEVAALTKVFRSSTPDVGFCRLGSVKANIGHLDAAAGVAGLIKTVLALQHREFPPLVNFASPNPQLDLESSPFVACPNTEPWPEGDTPRRAGVSSFGIGGTNAHVVLEEAPLVEPCAPLRDRQLLVVSARTETALQSATRNLVRHLEDHPSTSLEDVAWTLMVGRQAHAHRRAVVAASVAESIEQLSRAPAPAQQRVHAGGDRPVAFLLSGQGSQHDSMGEGLYRRERVYAEAIDKCAEILRPHLGIDIREAINGALGQTALSQTLLAQPALFALEYALASLWRHWGVTPVAMLGHSIGEIVAAHLAGVMSLEDALAVVAARGRLMQSMPPGAMLAVPLSCGDLQRLLGDDLEIAAINAPALCTVAGNAEAIARLNRRLASEGIDSRLLHTSHAFHSAMMNPAAEAFVSSIREVRLSEPRIPYVSNLTGTWITPEQATSAEYYGRQLRGAVLFESGVRTLLADQSPMLLELGPGNGLATLVRQTLGRDALGHVVSTLAHPIGKRDDIESFLGAAGQLWLAGVPLDGSAAFSGGTPRRVPLPTYPFERSRFWVDATSPETPARRPEIASQPAKADNWILAPTWMRDDSLDAAVGRLHGTWLVLDRGAAPRGLAELVVARLRAAGAVPVRVEPGAEFERVDAALFRVRPGNSTDILDVVRACRAASGPVAGVIYLWRCSAEADQGSMYAYHALVALAAGMEDCSEANTVHVVVATVGAERVLDEAVVDPEAALLRGPVLVLPEEVPGLRMRIVDIDAHDGRVDSAAMGDALVREAAAADAERLIARRAGRRWVRRAERAVIPSIGASELPLKRHGVYLITGGLGGMGLTLARWLASATAARLLLTARTAMPSREEWAARLAADGPEDRVLVAIRAIRDIEAAGGEVMTAEADVADATAMSQAIEVACSRWGGINGVIHAAGVAGRGELAARTSAAAAMSVLRPKVEGLRTLKQLLGDASLDFVALMSSVNSVAGTAGTCDYSAGNAFLDAAVDAADRPAGWARFVSINWGAWRDVGMAANLVVPPARRAQWEAHVRAGLSPAIGAELFARILASGRTRTIVVPSESPTGALRQGPARDASTGAAARSANGSANADSGFAASPEALSPDETPRGDVEQRLSRIWAEMLGIERIGANDDFFELGGHSLMATRVLSRVADDLGVRLVLRDVFEAPTIRRLAARIVDAGGAGSRGSTATSEPPNGPAGEREELEF